MTDRKTPPLLWAVASTGAAMAVALHAERGVTPNAIVAGQSAAFSGVFLVFGSSAR
jgi:hypothetical protein